VTGTTPIQAFSRSHRNPRLGVSCTWTVREGGHVVAQARNVWTDVGLSNLAAAISGGYSAPIYLVIDAGGTALSADVPLGGTSVTTDAPVDLSGDTQLVLNPGGPTQEVVTFSGTPTGNGPYTYTLTAGTLFSHTAGETVVRQVRNTDDMTTVTNEQQYDAALATGLRMPAVAGYSQGVGNWIMQFYFTGTQALVNFNTVGLSDNPNVGQGLLHDHAVLGYQHTGGNDVEIDVSITLTNN
jgi:hypothetical protein